MSGLVVCAVHMAVYFTRKHVPLYVYMTGEATISGTPMHPLVKQDWRVYRGLV
jgi:hypothetical protein